MVKIEQDPALVEDYLTRLIGIFSVTGSEEEIGNYIFDRLQEFGVDEVIRQPVADHRFNVVAVLKGKKPGPRILLTGHMDTVPAGEGWDTDPFTAVKKGDRIYGRGGLDMKSGIASVLSTVKFASEHREELPGELLIAFVPDEEAYSAGINALIKNGVKADFGIASEPEYEEALVGCVGKMLIEVDVKGVVSHGSKPEDGINAIEEGAKFLAALGDIPILTHPKISSQPYVTLKIDGGFKEYSIVVPEFCSFLINKHTVPDESKQFVLAEMEKLVKRLGLKASFTFTVREPYYPAFDIGEELPLLQQIGAAYEQIIGEPMKCGYGTGVSDNNRLVPLTGIPTICLGAKGAGLHSPNEWVSLASVLQMDLIYKTFLFNR